MTQKNTLLIISGIPYRRKLEGGYTRKYSREILNFGRGILENDKFALFSFFLSFFFSLFFFFFSFAFSQRSSKLRSPPCAPISCPPPYISSSTLFKDSVPLWNHLIEGRNHAEIR